MCEGAGLLIDPSRPAPLRANLRLSLRRAGAVRDYLVSRGISREAISVRGTGEEYVIIETADEVPESQNRVVWFLMIADEREPRC